MPKSGPENAVATLYLIKPGSHKFWSPTHTIRPAPNWWRARVATTTMWSSQFAREQQQMCPQSQAQQGLRGISMKN
jgi:hypothetical protein